MNTPSPVIRRRGLVQMHAAAVLAGATGLFGKFLSVSPSVITGGRTLVAFITLALAARRLGIDLRIERRRDLLCVAASGALLAAHWTAFFQSVQVSTVAIGLLVFSSYPLFVTFMEPIVFRERWHFSDFLAALAVAVGLAFVVPRFDPGDQVTRGLSWGLLSGFLCAAVSILTRSLVRKYPPLTVAFLQQGFAALCLLPFMVRNLSVFSGRTALLLLLLGVVFTAGLQILCVDSLRHIRAHTASVILTLEPVYGTIFAILLLHEVPSSRTVLGGMVVCGAVFATTLKGAMPVSARRREGE